MPPKVKEINIPNLPNIPPKIYLIGITARFNEGAKLEEIVKELNSTTAEHYPNNKLAWETFLELIGLEDDEKKEWAEKLEFKIDDTPYE